jgi:hypothetical protein
VRPSPGIPCALFDLRSISGAKLTATPGRERVAGPHQPTQKVVSLSVATSRSTGGDDHICRFDPASHPVLHLQPTDNMVGVCNQELSPIIKPHDQGHHCHSVRSGCAFRIAAVTSATFPAECGGHGMCLWRLDKLPAEAC